MQMCAKLIGSAENLLLVAVDQDDSVIGFVHANNHDPVYAPPMKDIVALVVDPDYRKAGLGRKLIRAVEDWAVSTGRQGRPAEHRRRTEECRSILQIPWISLHQDRLQLPKDVLSGKRLPADSAGSGQMAPTGNIGAASRMRCRPNCVSRSVAVLKFG